MTPEEEQHIKDDIKRCEESLNAYLRDAYGRQQQAIKNMESLQDIKATRPEKPPETEPALKPCPFCGGPGCASPYRRAFRKPRWYVECLVCNVGITAAFSTQAEAFAVWNHRVP